MIGRGPPCPTLGGSSPLGGGLASPPCPTLGAPPRVGQGDETDPPVLQVGPSKYEGPLGGSTFEVGPISPLRLLRIEGGETVSRPGRVKTTLGQ